ncbi:MAG: DinB family protein [Betaproteobacteria bacterium]|nr:DinB family protein [Betaproteobacteria bacterium]
MDIRTARTLTRYSAWANRLIFDAVAALPPGEATKPRQGLFKNMVHMLNHIYVIDRIFQAHLEGRPHGYGARNTPDHPPLEELRAAQQDIDAWYVAWSDRLTPAAMQEKVAFQYVGGGDGVMTRGEILLHVVNHTTYHRGFVAEMVYRVPATPPATDFTVYVRDVPQNLD